MLRSKAVRPSGRPSARVVTCSPPSPARGQLIGKPGDVPGAVSVPLAPRPRDRSPSPLRVSELSRQAERRSPGSTTGGGRDEEAERHCREKVQRLRDEVAALTDELEAERAARSTWRAEEAAPGTARDTDGGCSCRGDVSPPLAHVLRDSRGGDASGSSTGRRLLKARGSVLSRLEEAEEGSREVCRYAAALRDAVHDITHGGDLTCAEAARMEVLLCSLVSVEAAYGALGSLARRQQAQEKEKLCLRDEETLLLKKFTQSQLDNERLSQLLQEKQAHVQHVTTQLEMQKDRVRVTAWESRELEGERARLQRQLRSRAADGDRMAVRLSVLQKSVSRQRAEAGRLRREVATRAREREPLKAAARSYKRRAERGERDARQLGTRIRETEERLVEASSAMGSWRRRYDEAKREKAALTARAELLTNRIERLQDGVRALEESPSGRQELAALAAELARFRTDNEALQLALQETERRESRRQEEVEALKGALRQQSDSASQLKQQVDAVRDEAEIARAKLESLEAENHRLQQQQQQLTEAVEVAPQEGAAQGGDVAAGGARVRRLRGEGEQPRGEGEQLRGEGEQLRGEGEQLRGLAEELESEAVEAERRVSALARTLDERTAALAQEEARSRAVEARLGSLQRQLRTARERADVQVTQASEEEAQAERTAEGHVSELRAELRRAQTQLERLQRSAQQAERDRESAVEEAVSRLKRSRDGTGYLQRYVGVLRGSYERVFGGSLAMPVPPLSPV
uniref:Outer dense fiber protein 2-like n=1 Tax=Petromyzon marinus TaxID=7757 RepID=A0AAJ7XD44_PETMA|nr:outer dense fiber protein 2-like [Petromyzon marinus]